MKNKFPMDPQKCQAYRQKAHTRDQEIQQPRHISTKVQARQKSLQKVWIKHGGSHKIMCLALLLSSV